MNNMDKKTLHIILGPLAFAVCIFSLQAIFSYKAAVAIGLTVWMGLWWILRPVDIAVTRPPLIVTQLRYRLPIQ